MTEADRSFMPLAFDRDFDTVWSFGVQRAAREAEVVDRDLAAAAKRMIAELGSVIGIQLNLVPPGTEDSDQAWSELGGIIAVGMTLLRQLNEVCLDFAARLMWNFVDQTAGLGPTTPLTILSPARRFAADRHREVAQRSSFAGRGE